MIPVVDHVWVIVYINTDHLKLLERDLKKSIMERMEGSVILPYGITFSPDKSTTSSFGLSSLSRFAAESPAIEAPIIKCFIAGLLCQTL